MKSTLETRPVYVNTPEHIQAHLMICFIALTMLRILQHKLRPVLPAGEDLNWSYGLPGNRIARALADWQVDLLPGDYFRMLNADSEDLNTLFRAFSISVPRKLFSRGDLRSLKSAVRVF
jgi:hypothetical protein